ARTPSQVLAGLAPTPRGSWWRVHLTRPLTEPLTLEAAVELAGEGAGPDPAFRLAVIGSQGLVPLLVFAALDRQEPAGDPGAARWAVPLVTVPAAERLDGRVTLHLAGAVLVQAEAAGLQEVSEAARRDARDRVASLRGPAPSASSSWRTFRY